MSTVATIDQDTTAIKTAAARLATDPEYELGKPGLAAIYEPAFTAPTRGLAYPREMDDLILFIGRFAANPYEDTDTRMLALAFSDLSMYERTLDREPAWRRDAARDLVRDVAKYFARLEADALAAEVPS